MSARAKVTACIAIIVALVLIGYARPHGGGTAAPPPRPTRTQLRAALIVNTIEKQNPGTLRKFCKGYRDAGDDAEQYAAFASGPVGPSPLTRAVFDASVSTCQGGQR